MAKIINNIEEKYYNFSKIVFLDSKKVFYPISHSLNKMRIEYEDDHALLVKVLAEDIDYPSSSKLNDSGQIFDYKIKVDIQNQHHTTQKHLLSFVNKKVIIVLDHPSGQVIIGCNEQPLRFSYSEINTTSPSLNNAYRIDCSGSTYFSKVTAL